MVVGKQPGLADDSYESLYCSSAGRELKQCLAEAGIPNALDGAYFTNVCRFLPPRGKSLKKSLINQCSWFLWAEIMIIQPKMIVLLGSEAIKYFHGKSSSVDKTRGASIPLTYLLNAETEESPSVSFDTFSTIHPRATIREPALRDGLKQDLLRAYEIVRGIERKVVPRVYDNGGTYNPDCYLNTVDKVKEYVAARVSEMDQCHSKYKLAFDCEWDGRSPRSGGTLLTIQFSHKAGHAVLVPFNEHVFIPFSEVGEYKPGKNLNLIKFTRNGLPAIGYVWRKDDGEIDKSRDVEVLTELTNFWTPEDKKQVVDSLRELMLHPATSIGGHNIRADIPWVQNLGIDVVGKIEFGFDTILRHHLLCECGKQDLTSVMSKFTDIDRYDTEVHDWATIMSIGKNEGYGKIPQHLLYLYAMFDVDATIRSDDKLDELYSHSGQEIIENRQRLHQLYLSEMRACLGILEIENHGLLIDRDRVEELARVYADKREQLADELRNIISWPSFNYRSVFECRELLFGEQYNGKKRKDPDVPVRLRPAGGYCCNLTPLKTTDKPPVVWDKVKAEGRIREVAPSTDAESLGILGDQDNVANILRKIRFVDQICKNFTRLPKIDKKTGEIEEGGLLQYIDFDERVRTHLMQTSETGRWKSSKPNLQNLPKRREKELHAMFAPGEVQPYKIRSVFMADPGRVLIEADYKQAELITLAVLSGDRDFWDVLMEHPTVPVLKTDGKITHWLHPDWVKNVDVRHGDVIPAGSSIGLHKTANGAWAPIELVNNAVVDAQVFGRDLHAERAISGFRMPYCAVTHGPPKDFVEATSSDKRVAAKCLDPDTIVFTPFGPRTIADLCHSGRDVWDGDKFIACIKSADYTSERVILVTRDGAVRCTPDHRFELLDGSLKHAEDLKRGDKLALAKLPGVCSESPRIVSINPFTKEVGSGCAFVCLDEHWSYFFGIVQGDGSRTGDQYIISHGASKEYAQWGAEIKKAGEILGIPMLPGSSRGSRDRIRCGSKRVGKYLDNLGFGGSGGKSFRIPWWILQGGERVMYSYIMGLFDTDGTIGSIESGRGSATICTKDPMLAGQLVCLFQTLGFYSRISLSWNKTYKRHYYKVSIPAKFLVKCPFEPRVEQKRERWVYFRERTEKKSINKVPKYNEVLAVLPSTPGRVVDVQVDSLSHIYVQGGIRGHNTVNFGIPYGRSAPAIARELRQEGVQVEDRDCQQMIDQFYNEFINVARFLQLCGEAVVSPGFLVNPFWRYRHFNQVDDRQMMAQQAREASNFPIQSTVADCLNAAVYNCWAIRQAYRARGRILDYTLALGIHDALIFDAAGDSINELMRPGGIIDVGMSTFAKIPLPPKGICNGLYDLVDDSKFANGGFALGVDKDLFLRWAEKPDCKMLEAVGVPEKYWPKE